MVNYQHTPFVLERDPGPAFRVRGPNYVGVTYKEVASIGTTNQPTHYRYVIRLKGHNNYILEAIQPMNGTTIRGRYLAYIERRNFTPTADPQVNEQNGASLERALFFPKRPFHGCIPGYLVRISGVDTSYFYTEVAVADKRSGQEVEGIVR